MIQATTHRRRNLFFYDGRKASSKQKIKEKKKPSSNAVSVRTNIRRVKRNFLNQKQIT
jgi:hypothetical protein